MKVKQRPEDFVVREVSRLPISSGKYSVYRLCKSGIGTAEAVQQISHCWDLSKWQIQFAGRKDKHAVTEQHLTIDCGPKLDLEQPRFQVQYLGQASRPITAKDIESNQFEIQVRGLTSASAEQMLSTVDSESLAFPNYFGPQRFGSVGQSGQLTAIPWCLGDYERAVFLALAEANRHDSPAEQKQKRILRDNWGNWIECKQLLDRSNRRSVVTYLVDHPEKFKKAAGLIDRDMRSLYVAALQSRIWNEVASAILKQKADEYQSVEGGVAGNHLVFPTRLSSAKLLELQELSIPLPSSRPTTWPPGTIKLLEQVCQTYRLKRHLLRFSYPRDVFFSRARRSVLMNIRHLKAEKTEDELAKNQDRFKLGLQFELPAGQFATSILNALELISSGFDQAFSGDG